MLSGFFIAADLIDNLQGGIQMLAKAAESLRPVDCRSSHGAGENLWKSKRTAAHAVISTTGIAPGACVIRQYQWTTGTQGIRPFAGMTVVANGCRLTKTFPKIPLYGKVPTGEVNRNEDLR